VDIRKLVLILTFGAAMAGCSADPYKGRVPAPPDRVQPVAQSSEAENNPGATGSVPIGDGTESAAPNYSGHIPRVTGNH
jgi:hypothetical protein